MYFSPNVAAAHSGKSMANSVGVLRNIFCFVVKRSWQISWVWALLPNISQLRSCSWTLRWGQASSDRQLWWLSLPLCIERHDPPVVQQPHKSMGQTYKTKKSMRQPYKTTRQPGKWISKPQISMRQTHKSMKQSQKMREAATENAWGSLGKCLRQPHKSER